jgi:hypothetical protein
LSFEEIASCVFPETETRAGHQLAAAEEEERPAVADRAVDVEEDNEESMEVQLILAGEHLQVSISSNFTWTFILIA